MIEGGGGGGGDVIQNFQRGIEELKSGFSGV